MPGSRPRVGWPARAALALLLAWAALAGSARGATFTVTSTADTGAGSLRQAILDANASADASDTINFMLPASSTITLASDLPDLTGTLSIDATGAPGLVVDGDANQILGTAGNDVTLVDLDAQMGGILLGNDDTLTFSASQDSVLAADIADAGAATGDSLVKQGNAELDLAGTNTFTGTVDVQAGTLKANTGSLPSSDVSVAMGATLELAQDADDTFTGAIDGDGSLVKSGTGNLTLSGMNAYTGGTEISDGTLTGDTDSLQGDILNDAALVFDQAADGAFAGDVSGSGALTKEGAGNLTLGGTNSYTGGTTIDAGTLTGDTDAIQGDVVNDAALVFAQPTNGTFAGNVSGSGALTKEGAGNLTLTGSNSYSGGTTISAGTLTGDTDAIQGDVANDAALVFDQATDDSYDDVISGTGDVTKRGAGTLTIPMPQTYTGLTSVDAGTLALDGSVAGDATVEAPGTLAGGGSVAGALLARGSISPGGAAQDTFSVGGVADFEAGSRFVVDMDASDSGDQLAVTGMVDIDPTATLVVRPAPGDYTLASTITALTSAGVTGTFLEGEPFAFLDRTVTYPGGSSVQIELVANGASLATIGATPNRRAVGGALATLVGSPDPDLTELFDNLNTLTASEAQAALDALSGESLSAFTSARAALDEKLERSIGRRARAILFASNAAWPAHLGTPDPRPRPTRRPPGTSDVAAPRRLGETGLGAWLEPFGVLGEIDGDGNSADLEYTLFGSLLGVDLRLGDHGLVGAAAGYARTELDVDDRGAEGDADTLQGAAYAAWANRRVFASVSGRYAFTSADHQRDLVIGTIASRASSDFDAHDYGARGELALLAFEAGPVALEPLAAIGWTRFTREDVDEGGAGSLGLSLDDETLDSVRLQLGARLHGLFEMDRDAVFAPELRAYWLRELGDDERRVEASLAGAPFVVTGAEAPRDAVLFGGGWAIAISRNVRASLEYDLRLDADRMEHLGAIAIRARF